MSNNKSLVFSLEEFQERVRRTRQSMDKAGLDLLLVYVPENIYYLTGYQTPGYYTYQCFILPLESDPIMLTRLLEVGNVHTRSWVEETVTYTGIEDVNAKGPVTVTLDVLEEIGAAGKRIGIEKGAWFLSPRDYEQIVGHFSDSEFVDATDVVNELRLIKSPAEIAYIRKAARAAESSMTQALETIAVGKTDLDVATAVMAGGISAGSEYTGLPPFIATGTNSAVAHATWEGRILKEGDPIFLELPGCVKRYHAALERTAVIGNPPTQWQEMSDVAIGALTAAIDTIEPGVTSGDVHAAVRGVIENAGYGKSHCFRSGYSIGIAFPPDWGEGHILSLRAADPTVLRPGMTFHICIMLTLQAEAGIGSSETVLVTETGCEVVTDYPRKLYVID